jgi:hypothetical protein
MQESNSNCQGRKNTYQQHKQQGEGQPLNRSEAYEVSEAKRIVLPIQVQLGRIHADISILFYMFSIVMERVDGNVHEPETETDEIRLPEIGKHHDPYV